MSRLPLLTIFLVWVQFLSLLSCCSGLTLIEPTVIRSDASVWNATITVEMNRYVNSEMSFNTRNYCYQGVCTFPGPTIEMKPGDTFTLIVQNKLGAETGTMKMDYMHFPNTTNVHTHGLHISPVTDSVFIEIPPGGTHTYVYELPANHAPGLHWYHHHYHGSSTFNVMGGLHGALIVAPAVSGAQNIPASYTALTKHVMVISHLQFSQQLIGGAISQGCGFGNGCSVYQGCSSGTTNSPFNPFRSYSYLEMSPEIGNAMSIDPIYTNVGQNASDLLVVNGQYQPTVSMAVNEVRIFKFVQSTGALTLKFIQLPNQCSFNVIAIDGVFLRAQQTRSQDWYLNQAGRFEVQVSCSSAGTYTIVEQFHGVLFFLSISGTTTTTPAVTNAELAAIVRPKYLNDLNSTNQVVDSTFEVEFSQGGRQFDCQFWLGSGSNCSAIWTGAAQPSGTLAGNTCQFERYPGQRGGTGTSAWNASSTYKHVTAVGQVNEWKIYGLGNDAHSFHLHVNHVQVIAFEPTPGTVQDFTQYYQIGEWRDTLPALDGMLTIRFLASDFPGETVFHCHFLRHEDLGMMSSFYVCDPNTPGACPDGLTTASSSSTGTVVTTSSSSSTGSVTGTSSSSGPGTQNFEGSFATPRMESNSWIIMTLFGLISMMFIIHW